MSGFEWLLCFTAAFFAGGLNTIAGGGSFLTLPALIFVGLPPIHANATSAVAVLPGYLGGCLGFREELKSLPQQTLWHNAVISVVGALIGAGLLLITPGDMFRALVPYLLLFATVIFALGKPIRRWAAQHAMHPRHLLAQLGLLLVCAYGGYFNGGLGIMLLALFYASGMHDLNAMNGLKNALSLIISLISVLAFAGAGIIDWPSAAIMMLGAIIGGYSAAHVAKQLPEAWVHRLVVLVGASMSVLFFLTE